jgi:hypothetical protein
MQPAVVDQITHIPISLNYEANFPASGQPIIRIILVVFVAFPIFPNALAIEALIFEFFPDVPEVVNDLGVLESSVESDHLIIMQIKALAMSNEQ